MSPVRTASPLQVLRGRDGRARPRPPTRSRVAPPPPPGSSPGRAARDARRRSRAPVARTPLELLHGSPVCLVAHADRLQQRQGSARTEQRGSLRPTDARIDPVERRCRKDRVEQPHRERHVLEPAEVEAHELGVVHAPPRDLDHVRSRLDRIDAQAAGNQLLGQFPGPRSHLDDSSTRAETRQLDRGTDDLARIARSTRVVCLGHRVEHAAMPPWFGHQVTSSS